MKQEWSGLGLSQAMMVKIAYSSCRKQRKKKKTKIKKEYFGVRECHYITKT